MRLKPLPQTASAVLPVCGREYQRPNDRKHSIRIEPQLRVRKSCSGHEQQHADCATGDNAQVVMPTKTDTQCNDTQWNHDDQHLGMQMSCGELGEKWQADHHQRQCKAMHETQRRQRDCGAVEPIA